MFPKLLGPDEDELAMNLALGLSLENAVLLSRVAGVGELIMAVLVLVLWRHHWPLFLTIALMVLLLACASVAVPHLLIGAFNPVTINVCVITLALIGLKSKVEAQEK